MKSFQVGIIGREKIDHNDNIQLFAIDEAYKLGKMLASEKYTVLTGGLGGIMEAVCKGVYENNGNSIGIIPKLNEEEKKIRKINDFQNCKIHTGMDQRLRIPIFINSCDAIVVISGGMGTWLEACFALANEIPIITLPQTGRMAEKISVDETFKGKIIVSQSVEETIKSLNNIRKNFAK